MAYLLLEEDLFVKNRIIDPYSSAGQKIHDFLRTRARRLAGGKIDFEKNPAAFVMADIVEPNAFYASAPQDHDAPERNEYENIRYTKNPLNVPVICLTRGLIDMVDNLDQLDYVLGHELTHLIIKGYGIEGHSKGEELLSNLHAVDLVYDAGSDPKQALAIADKLHKYAQQHEEEAERNGRHRASHKKQTGMNWSKILDEHMSHGNARTALEASLTRLSHLIDEREPSKIDKSVFAVEYSDPVTEFLKANNYENKKALGKLKILIDCIDHLSTKPISAKEYYQSKLEALSEQEAGIDPEDRNAIYKLKEEEERIQGAIDGGYKSYFSGVTMKKAYQQKIAALAEGVFEQAYQRQEKKRHPNRRVAINVRDLSVYMQNKAYQHIKRNGYPEAEDANFFEASGILYTYFYALLKEHAPSRKEGHERLPRVLPQIEVDLEAAKQRTLDAQAFAAFVEAAEEYKRLTKTYRDLSSISYGNGHHITKLDNLSFLHVRDDGFSSSEGLYPDLKLGKPAPWNNLVGIAKTSDEAQAYVVAFLKEQGIKDYRITHDQPFVQKDLYSSYGINAEGIVSEIKREYELDYALRTDLVLRTYAYIKDYFEDEAALFDATCHDVLDVMTMDDLAGSIREKVKSFVQLYNSLPQEDDTKRRRFENDSVLSLISSQFLKENPLPCLDDAGNRTLDDALFGFSNPVFQQHFGEDFKGLLTERKSALRQKMFATVFQVVNAAADAWPKISSKTKEVDERKSALLEQERALRDNDSAREKIAQELKALYGELRSYQARKDLLEGIVLICIRGIVEKGEHRQLLNRLTPQQEEFLADYIIRDEKGIFGALLGVEQYESFCNFRRVLAQQIEKVVSGDYALTDVMQMAADALGYQKDVCEDRGQGSKYICYLQVFDAMRHLEKSSEISLRALAKAIGKTEISNQYGEKASQERRQSYVKLIRESRLPKLVAKAIDCQKNYVGLSVDEMIKTVDGLVSLRGQLARQLVGEVSCGHYYDAEGYWSERKKNVVRPEHQKVLDILDKNIRGTIRKAQHQALQKEDALEKIIDLYHLYDVKDRDIFDTRKKDFYLRVIAKKEKTLEKISALSQKADFWPEDVWNHIRAHIFAKNTFLDDIAFEDRLLNDILNKLEKLPSGEKKKECLFVLLDKNLRAPYPETRERLFAIYSDDVLAEFGVDDGSKEYQEKFAKVLEALEGDKKKIRDIGTARERCGHLLSDSLSAADKYLLLRRISDKILSQEETSGLIRKACQINLTSESLAQSYLYGVGVDYLTAEMDRDPDTAKKFIWFLNSKGEDRDCGDMSAYIKETLFNKKRDNVLRYGQNEILENTKPINCKILYKNFWAAPLEARAIVITSILKCAINGQQEDERKAQQSWETVFDLVMDHLISPDDVSIESRYARDVMHSYIKARSDYEREIILSAMLVANRNIGTDAGNVGKALKLFLENMGPAEIKLGQAIASYPNTPESIRKELQKLKNMADVPTRWTLYEWMRAENIPEELWKEKRLGNVLGSASYYTTVALGDNDVLRILRPEAREKAAKGFKVIGDMVRHLQEKDHTSDLDYGNLTTSVAEMVEQAARMAGIETDHEIGQKQCERAQEIYDGLSLGCGGETFHLKVMGWKARGPNWVIMPKAKGPVFNDLPEDTPEQRAYKKAFAKAYIVFELRRILSGRQFDHDKHGAQLCLDRETNDVGIFDTGAMALSDPTVEEQRQLGQVLHDVMKDASQQKSGSFTRRMAALEGTLSDKIKELYENKVDPRYLVEVKKGMLALGDFLKVLDEGDIKNLISEIDISSHISPPIKSELLKGLSFFEQMRLFFLSARNPFRRGQRSVIVRQCQSAVTDPVKRFTGAPNASNKSGWFQDFFANSAARADEKGPSGLRPPDKSTRHFSPRP